MFNFWRSKNLINEIDCEWIFETFAFNLTHFDARAFHADTQLIQPIDAFFPGRINSPTSMAETVFKSTVKHCGLRHWPFTLHHDATLSSTPPYLARTASLFNRHQANELPSLSSEEKIGITYNAQQTTLPGDLAATFSHLLAQHFFAQSQLTPEGGDDLFAQHTEILAVMMGFGVMISNSAYAFRGSCARCFNPQAHRQASLSEDKVIFALALFCELKNIPKKEAIKHLKPYLRSLYKQSVKQIHQHPKKLQALLSIRESLSG